VWRLDYVGHCLVADVEEKQIAPGVLQQEYLVFLEGGRETGQVACPLDDLVETQVCDVQEIREEVRVVD